ncbi:MAG: TonB-dependent receptor [Spartobacteria bacterium]|nr:TonB-dependent receptor [Spartobacteria bacterium]
MIRHPVVFFLCFFMTGSVCMAEESPFTLGDIIVSAAAEDNSDFQAGITTRTVSDTTMQTWAFTQVDDALSVLPGVYVRTSGKGQQMASIRGFGEGDVKVFVDGVPATETYFRSIDLQQFPAAFLSGIDVVAGLPSLLYGANTMGGVINMVSRQGDTNNAGSAAIEAGSAHLRHGYVEQGLQEGAVSMWGAVDVQEADGFRFSSDFHAENEVTGKDSGYREDGGLRENSDYKRQAAAAKMGYEGEQAQCFVSAMILDNPHGIPIEYNRYWRFDEWRQSHIQAVGNWSDDNTLVRGQVFYMEHRDTLVDDAEQTLAAHGKSWFDESRYDDDCMGAYGVIQQQVASHLFDLSGRWQRDRNRQQEYNTRSGSTITVPGWGTEKTFETDTASLGLQDTWTKHNLSVTAGMAYDRLIPRKNEGIDTLNDEDSWNPQLRAIWRIDESTQFKAGAGQVIRFPHMKELYSEVGGGNPDLKPQTAWTYETGLQHDLFMDTRICRLEINGFYNDVRDLIEQETQTEQRYYHNIGKAQLAGVETTADWNADPLHVFIHYTWLHARDKTRDRRLQKEPVHQLNAGASYALPWNMTLSLLVTCVADQVAYTYDKQAGTDTTRDLPDAAMLDIVMEQNLCFGAVLYAKVTNLTDRNVDFGDGPEPGRSFLCGLRLNW